MQNKLDQGFQAQVIGIMNFGSHEKANRPIKVNVGDLYTVVFHDQDVQGNNCCPEGAPGKSAVVADFNEPVDQPCPVDSDIGQTVRKLKWTHQQPGLVVGFHFFTMFFHDHVERGLFGRCCQIKSLGLTLVHLWVLGNCTLDTLGSLEEALGCSRS